MTITAYRIEFGRFYQIMFTKLKYSFPLPQKIATGTPGIISQKIYFL